MTKNDLPVIILKGLVLLPSSDARIELNNDITKEIINLSRDNYDNQVLIVSPIDKLEEAPITSDLPESAILAEITNRIDLPNKSTRIVLEGKKRLKVLKYYNLNENDNILHAIVVPFRQQSYSEAEEIALIRALTVSIEEYISLNPNISNSIINQLKTINSLDDLTDAVTIFLPLSNEKKSYFMHESSKILRAKRLIEEISIEIEVLNIESKIDEKLRINLDTMQKEMILKEKINIIKKEIGEATSKEEFIKQIQEQIDNNNIPDNIKRRIKNELHRYDMVLENNPEISNIRNYIETVLSIPFNNITTDQTSLKQIENELNETHYGLDEVKERIIENVAVKLNNEEAQVPTICLIGPPGVGKTTLAYSIAKALNKKFAKISLGGLNDPQELIGHRKTYLGSEPGKIISTLIKCESMNPVILLDEIDKMSVDYKGDPSSVLLDLLEISQNKSFTDNFVEEGIDLSKVTFILTANDINSIPKVLLDRLDIIELNSYLNYEKENIANNYLIKNALKNCGVKENVITFTKESIRALIEEYTKESGVRQLDRLINRIIKKVITKAALEEKEIENIVITKENLVHYLKNPKYRDNKIKHHNYGYVVGLAYTPYGGETLEIEVTSYEGKESFIASGHLGETLKESIEIALGYIKANKEKLNIKKEDLNKTLHINFREGAVPKEGPSAGTMITTAIISYLLKKEVPANIKGSGEITLLGDVLAVGGLREKCLSAIKNGIKKIYLGIENKEDINELPKEIKSKLEFKFVKNYIEIYNDIFKK